MKEIKEKNRRSTKETQEKNQKRWKKKMKDERNNKRDEGKVGEIKGKMKEKLEYSPIEKRKRKTVNIILKKNKTTRETRERDERDLLEFSLRWYMSKKNKEVNKE
jgi:hypothetical protein